MRATGTARAAKLMPHGIQPGHIHLPSVHVRTEDGPDFDYEEDLIVSTHGRKQRVDRFIRLVVLECGEPTLIRETFDTLCAEEVEQLEADLPILMDAGHPAATAMMEECARREFDRQMRIVSGEEKACARCGCSETRACSGGCIWATETLCSRCTS